MFNLFPFNSQTSISSVHSRVSHLDPSQVEFCLVMGFKTDIIEDTCFSLPSTSSQSNKPPSTTTLGSASHHDQPKSGDRVISGPCSGHISANPVHSHSQDRLTDSGSVLVISDSVRVNIHPQEKANQSFGAFLDPVIRL